jgi:hypothetical protein
VENHAVNPGLDQFGNQANNQSAGHESQHNNRSYIVWVKMVTVHIFSFRLILIKAILSPLSLPVCGPFGKT